MKSLKFLLVFIFLISVGTGACNKDAQAIRTDGKRHTSAPQLRLTKRQAKKKARMQRRAARRKAREVQRK